ncbi:MAG: DNA-processing protein DprA [Clostridia bacterium]|nr:DNA-processing protein DprA [Clostridia bacterium]
MKLEEKLCLIMSSLEISNNKQRELFSCVDLELLWTNFYDDNQKIKKILGEKDLSRLKSSLNQTYLDAIITQIEKNGVTAVTYFSPDYPQKLKDIPDPPYTLYCKGDVSILNSDGIAVVGTRKISAYGRRVTAYFTDELAKHFTIISGLAYGVDTVAHETALKSGGKTIAVLGSGVCNIYPAANENLARKILENGGLIVSEFGIFGEPNNYHFPMRNRIVSGLSRALLITEAPLKSGTMTTLEHALEQGKDVYAVPGEIYSQNSMGCNELLKRLQGALVTDPKDILREMNVRYEKKEKKAIQLDLTQQSVVNLLIAGKKNFDELVETTKLNPSELAFVLSNLELMGCIMKLPGNVYQYMED